MSHRDTHHQTTVFAPSGSFDHDRIAVERARTRLANLALAITFSLLTYATLRHVRS